MDAKEKSYTLRELTRDMTPKEIRILCELLELEDEEKSSLTQSEINLKQDASSWISNSLNSESNGDTPSVDTTNHMNVVPGDQETARRLRKELENEKHSNRKLQNMLARYEADLEKAMKMAHSMRSEMQQRDMDIETLRNDMNTLKTQLQKTADEKSLTEQFISMTRLRALENSDINLDLEDIQELRVALENAAKTNVSTTPDGSDHIMRIRAHHSVLVTKLKAKFVAAKMFEHCALTLRELESVQCCESPIDAADALLDILIQQPANRLLYDCFIDSLKEVRQDDVRLTLLYQGHEINTAHAHLIQQHYLQLVDSIDSKYSGLIEQLLADSVVDSGEADELTREVSVRRRNEKLLGVLNRRSAEHYQQFLAALDKTGQTHLADSLRNSTGEPKPIGERLLAALHDDNLSSARDIISTTDEQTLTTTHENSTSELLTSHKTCIHILSAASNDAEAAELCATVLHRIRHLNVDARSRFLNSTVVEQFDFGDGPFRQRLSAVHIAAYHGNADVVRVLCEAGVDVNGRSKRCGDAPDQGFTPLHLAAVRGEHATVRRLLELGADVRAATQFVGVTPLHKAACRGSADVVEVLVGRGAEVNAKDERGVTPLYVASLRGHVGVVRLLIDSGADVNACSTIGTTALTEAALQGHVEVVRLLLENGADVNAKGVNDATALYNAAHFGHTDVVRLLLERKADMKVVCKSTPVAIAYECGHEEIVHLLMTHLAQIEDYTWRSDNAGPLEDILPDEYFGR